jgi:hypothetical protein
VGLKSAVTVKFSTVGVRRIYLRGYNSAGTQVAGTYKDIRIEDLIQNVPYFFQYSNSISPGGSCQNTLIAMLLNFQYISYGKEPIRKAINTSAGARSSPSGCTRSITLFEATRGESSMHRRVENCARNRI